MMNAKIIADTLGRADLADAFGCGATAVSNHVSAGKFPADWWPVMRKMAKDKGIDLPIDLFKFKKDARKPIAIPTPAPSTPKVEANGCAQ